MQKKKKLKLKRDGTVFLDETPVGYVRYELEKEYCKRNLLRDFKDEKNVVPALQKMRMPKNFIYIWINKLFVKKSKRSKGYGSEILELLEKKFKDYNLVISLSAGQLVKTTDMDKLLPFYEREGFKIISTDKHYFGFKVVK
jgi:GNAT superfamily N-acetyltransferase